MNMFPFTIEITTTQHLMMKLKVCVVKIQIAGESFSCGDRDGKIFHLKINIYDISVAFKTLSGIA